MHSLKRYGIRGDDIHSWMDEPSQVSGATHRKFRHDLKSLPIAIKIFGKKYGDEMVENIFLDHLKADSEEDRLEAREKQPKRPQAPFDWVIPDYIEVEPDHDGKVDSTPLPHESISNHMSKAEKLLIAISVGISFLILVYVLINAFGHPLGLW